MPKRSHLALAVAFSAAVLGGCGGAAESAQPAPSKPAAVDNKHRLETAKADCMKQKGFKYIPYVRPEKQESDEERKRASGDYQAMRKYRAKYGYGVFAMHVYPKEMKNPAVEPEPDPNMKVQSQLSAAQAQSYRKAADGCMIAAAKQVLGLELKSFDDYFAQMNVASERAADEQLNSDPGLVESAGAMATCLKGKGYSITDTKPTAMAERGQRVFLTQEDKIGREQSPDVPDVAPPRKEGEIPMMYQPTLTPEEARPHLNKEIKAALDDLECGKDFYPAYEPRSKTIERQVSGRFGM
ncbi:hypothetical protein [Nonomuraea solani]|nr:hypothetical protein [Nonomuraea solani]